MKRRKIHQLDPAGGTPGQVPTINPAGTKLEYATPSGGGSGGVDPSRLVDSGTGLTGGGDLSADRTIAIDLTAEAERIRDVIGAALVQGSNVTITVDDAGDTITISAASTTDPEVVRDTIGAALVPGAGITIVVDDAGDHITISSTATSTSALVPMTTTIGGGDPQLVFTDDGEVLMMEVPQ